ncbi:hypothetical protein EDC01DRAFT_514385 [Geopyxis carbonaria]|nr:hypothetical protein EDC01DRAFT_514385 [Geopyxis carbonaria]
MYHHGSPQSNGYESFQRGNNRIQPPLAPTPPAIPSVDRTHFSCFEPSYHHQFPTSQRYLSPYERGSSLNPVQGYITNPQGLPVNLSRGAIVTESRGVFIGNLPFNTQWQELKDFLQDAGRVVRCDVPQVNGKGKGHATALFDTPAQAQRACDLFNGSSFMGRPLRVRIDKYATRKSATESSYPNPPSGRY